MKRVLLVAEDQLVSNYHRGRFETMGITVDTARSIDSARKMARDRNPDLTIIDPIMAGTSPIEAVQTLRDSLDNKEMWVVSRLPNPVGKAMEKAGANRVTGRAGELEGSISSTMCARRWGQIRWRPGGGGGRSMTRGCTRYRRGGSAEAINALRVTLHDFVKDPRSGVGLYELFRQAHASYRTASPCSAAPRAGAPDRLRLEALIYDLYTMPEQINPSIVRTVSQAIDFLAVLFNEDNLRRLKDPAQADVFVVDDEPPARQMISAAMKLVSLKITCADNAEMALSVLGDNQFDLIFLDVNMPHSSGFELCTQIRQLEDHRKTPIVFLTGMNTFQNRAQGSLSGGNDFIGKPFNLLELGVKALMWIFKGQLAN